MKKSDTGLKVLARGIEIAGLAFALAACGSEPSGQGEETVEGVGSVSLEIVQAPSDALCLRIHVEKPATEQQAIRNLALTAGQTTSIALTGLPTGSITLFAETFNVACGSVTATTPLTWSSELVSLTLTPDFTPFVALVLRRAGNANVNVDFVSAAQIVEAPIQMPALRLAADPSDGSIVFTTEDSRLVGRTRTPGDAQILTTTPGPARYVAVAPDRTIYVALGTPERLLALSPAGVIIRTVSLPFPVSDLQVDGQGNVWAGSLTVSGLLRVTPAGALRTIQLGNGPSPAVALAPDGSLRVGTLANRIFTVTNAGDVQSSIPAPFQVRDLAVNSDGSMIAVSAANTVTAQIARVSPDGQSLPLPGTANAADVSVVATARGTVVGQAHPPGGLFIVQNSAAVSVLPLPNNGPVTALTQDRDGRLWATDAIRPRLLMIRLP